MKKKRERKGREKKKRKREDKTNKFEEVRFSNKKKKIDLLEILIKATKNYVEKEINETSSLFNWYR